MHGTYRAHLEPGDVAHLARVEREDAHEGAEVGSALVGDAQRDVGVHGREKRLPVTLEPVRPVHRHRGREPGGPGSVQQRAELEVVVRVQVRDEDQRQVLERHALIDQATCHAEPAIDDDALATEGEQVRRRHRRAGPDGGATLGAEQGKRVGVRRPARGVHAEAPVASPVSIMSDPRRRTTRNQALRDRETRRL